MDRPRKTLTPSLRGFDPNFSGITPQMEAAFALLDQEMARSGYSTPGTSSNAASNAARHFPRGEGKGGKGLGKGRSNRRGKPKDKSMAMSAYRTADPSMMIQQSRKSKVSSALNCTKYKYN